MLQLLPPSGISNHMAYRFKAGETVPENVQRVVVEEIDSAMDQLGKAAQNRDEAIHEARKSVKKIRGVLRLMRPELRQVYAEETKRFREIGHQLSDIRDAAARLEIFNCVVEKYKGTLQKNALTGIRHRLEQTKQEAEQSPETDKVVQIALGAFRSAARRVKAWPLKKDGFSAIAPGLRLTYRAGRAALRLVEKDGSAENFHYFRRRAKDHWYHVRLLESLWTEVMQAHEGSIKKLEQWLGDDHNLVVLREMVEDEPEKYGGEEEIRIFVSLADQEQKEMRQEAISMGQRVYEQKPRQFVTDMSKLWDAWLKQPDSMKDAQKQQRQGAKKQAQSSQGKKSKSAA
jgi:CHAD domain-containing protein